MLAASALALALALGNVAPAHAAPGEAHAVDAVALASAPEAEDPVGASAAVHSRQGHAVDDIGRKWSGLGVGYDNGLVGRDFAQGLKLDIPLGPRLGRHFGVRTRGFVLHPEPDAGASPLVAGGVELFGRGPVLLGIVRVYGGGGVYAAPDGDTVALGGGGHYGFEALVATRMSFTFEIGGQGGAGALRPLDGASVLGGMTIYLGDLSGEEG